MIGIIRLERWFLGLVVLFGVSTAQAQDATWVGGGSSPDEWNSAANWTPVSVPTGTATFTATGVTNVANNTGPVSIGTIDFSQMAQTYTFSIVNSFTITGSGVDNASPNPQFFNITTGSLNFQNSSTANSGSSVIDYENNSTVSFQNSSSAGNLVGYINRGAGATMSFADTSTAGISSIIAEGGTTVRFGDSSTAGTAYIFNGGGTVVWNDNSSAGTATINNTSGSLNFNGVSTGDAATISNGANIIFAGTSTADKAIITNQNAPPFTSALLTFDDSSSAGQATIINAGTFTAAIVTFNDTSNAGGATLTNNPNNAIIFNDSSSAGNATINNLAGGSFGPGTLSFTGLSTAGNATIVSSGVIVFSGASNAGAASITLNLGGVEFNNSASAANASIVANNAGISFADNATAGNATLTANNFGIISFGQASTGGVAQIILAPDTLLTLSGLTTGGTSVGSIAGAGAIDLGNKVLTIGGNDLSTVFSGTLWGTGGSLVKVGVGTLVLDGASEYTGSTLVAAGELEIGNMPNLGANVVGDVTVTGGVLSGYGTIGGNLVNSGNGIVIPGTTGMLTIRGNYQQGTSATLVSELGPNGSSGLKVVGTANLSGDLGLLYDPGVLIGKEYVVLDAGNVVGRFAATAGAPPFGYLPALTYTPTQVDVALEPVANGAADGVWSSVTSAIVENAQQANALLMAHLASLGADTPIEPLADAATPLRLATNDGGINAALAGLPDAMSHLGGWFRATGNFISLGGDVAAPGFDTQGSGFLAGFDHAIGEHYIAGIAAGFSRTSLSQSTGSAGTIDTPRVMLYGSAALGRVTVDGAVGYAYDSIASTRANDGPGTAASSSYSGQEATAALQATGRFDFDGVAVVPAGGLDYVHLGQAAFAETGAAGLDAAVASETTDSLRPFISVSASRSFTTDYGMTVTPEADLAWTHELLTTARNSVLSLAGNNFSVVGVSVPRDELIVGGGIGARMTDRLALYVDYHAVLPTTNLFEQIVSAGLHCRF